MSDSFEIDFLDVESSKSGDAIAIRSSVGNETRIHVTDGGFQDTGDRVVEHINKFYDKPSFIDALIVSHPDGDHAGGLRKVIEEFEIGELWMLRPWLYVDELIDRFSRFTSTENLAKRLKDIYPNISALEELAEENAIPIREPFQGATIGQFIVMAPTKSRYLDLVVKSDKTPESAKESEQTTANYLRTLMEKAIDLVKAAWGQESFSSEETSAENDMSVIQYANLCGIKILLTADAGRTALSEAADYAPYIGLTLPGINKFQIPHHGSRRNVSTDILDRWLGKRLSLKPEKGKETFTAVVSSAKKDEDHPRKAVLRALIHRGAKVLTTEGKTLSIGHNNRDRGWGPATPVEYPEEQEN
jgi:beta-lactamase superfamily II metal-dependent hydrolase